MTIRFPTSIQAWRRARDLRKRRAAPRPRMPDQPATDPGAAAVYAAGLVCAGQVGETRRG